MTCALLVAGKAASRIMKSLSTPSRHGVKARAGILWEDRGAPMGGISFHLSVGRSTPQSALPADQPTL